MKNGYSPVAKVVVRMNDTGKEVVKTVRKELHHIAGRGGSDPHNISNLQELWSWEHAAVDSSRHTGYEFLRFK